MEKWPAVPFTGGGDLWSYTSCNTGRGNTPEWLVDYPPINERIQAGFLNWTQAPPGFSITALMVGPPQTPSPAGTMWTPTLVAPVSAGRVMEFSFIPGPIGSTEPARHTFEGHSRWHSRL